MKYPEVVSVFRFHSPEYLKMKSMSKFAKPQGRESKSHLITISKIKCMLNHFHYRFLSYLYLCVCRVMEDGSGKVEIVDLHSVVIHECGEPPYETCSIMKRPRDVVRYFC